MKNPKVIFQKMKKNLKEDEFSAIELDYLETLGIKVGDICFKSRDFTQEKLVNHTFIISCVVANTFLNTNMLESMKNFAKLKKATLILLGTKPHQKPFYKEQWYPIEAHPYIKFNVTLHELLRAVDLDILPQQINPLAGLQEFSMNKSGNRDSCIIASPKQDLEMLPYRHNKIPHALYSTGTISIPDYQDNRIGKIAEQTHIFGGLIVEIASNKNSFNVVNFQFRQSDGSFIDRGTRYHSNGDTSQENACSMVIGDVHAEVIDKIALEETGNQILRFLPDKIFLHDIVSWESVNPHMGNSVLNRHLNLNRNLTMKEEISKVNEVLGFFVSLPTKIYAVASNHDLFVNRYLLSGQYALDPVNLKETTKCVSAMIEGKSPYSALFDFENSVVWMSDTEDFIEHSIQHAAHGHLGSGGSKGSPLQYSKTFVKSTSGHTHSPRIRHGAYSVGTISQVTSGSHGYNKGITNWAQANVVLWHDGTRQMLFLWNSFVDSLK